MLPIIAIFILHELAGGHCSLTDSLKKKDKYFPMFISLQNQKKVDKYR